MPPEGTGWTGEREYIYQTKEQITDKLVEKAVREELKRQGEHRRELEDEHKKKYGVAPDMRATNDEIANVMDNKTADGSRTLHVKGVHKRR